MTLPYLPSGTSYLPANRFIMFADGDHLIQRIDESAKTLDGVSFTSWWETGSLNQQTLHEETLALVTIVYSSLDDTSLRILVSGDGGETWADDVEVDIEATSEDRVRRLRQGFNVSGFDLRIRLELDQDELFHVYELHPEIVVRGKHVIE